MNEFLRIYRRKNIILLCLLMFLNTGIFVLCADPEKSITKTGAELSEYLEQYPGFLYRTIEGCERRLKLSVYGSGFSAEILEKSLKMYEELAAAPDMALSYDDNRGIVLFGQYRISAVFVFIFLFVIVSDFMEERRKGLDRIVRSTALGRGRLFLKRVLILLFSAFIATVVIYGGCLMGVSVTFCTGDIERCIQSIPEFMNCPYSLSVANFIAVICLLKAIGFFFSGLVLYSAMYCFGKRIAYVFCLITMLFEAGCAYLISPVSSLNLLRYINIFSLINTEGFFERCVVLNVFGKAVTGVKTSVIIFLILTAGIVIVVYFLDNWMHVKNEDGYTRFENAVHRFLERRAAGHTLTGWELKKLLITQGAFIITAGVVAIHVYMSYRYDYIYPVNEYEKMDYIKYSGEITEENYRMAERELGTIRLSVSTLEKRLEKENSKEKPSSYYVTQLQDSLKKEKYRLDCFEKVWNDIHSGYEYSRQSGVRVWLVEPYSYEIYILRDKRTYKRASFLALFAVIGCISGIYAYDRQNNMSVLINGTRRGRFVQKIIKPVLAVCLGMLIMVIMHLVQYVHLNANYGFSDMSAPLKSLSFMREYPLNISIRAYFFLTFAKRAAVGGITALCTAFVSRISRDRFAAMGICTFIFMAVLFFTR